MLPCKELEQVVAFIRKHASKQPINETHTDEQIACYFLERCRTGQALASYEGTDKLKALVFFEEREDKDKLYIEQLWCDGKNAFRSLLKELRTRYPNVRILVGYRRKSGKDVGFRLETLNKIFFYGT